MNARSNAVRPPVLEITNLKTWFATPQSEIKAVDGVSFSVQAGEVLGLVGESGSGKSITGFSIIGLIDEPGRIVEGSIRLEGQELVGLPGRELRKIRGKTVSMVFQDPMMALNPVLDIGTQMRLALMAHQRITKKQARERSIRALEQVRIRDPEQKIDLFPHEFSGGMRQRVAIAVALLHKPKLIICDEPTTALDVSVQAEILSEMKSLVAETGTALIWISHDLATVSSIADRVAVMQSGKIVEIGDVEEVLSRPVHAYTKSLLAALPSRSEPGKLLLGDKRIANIPAFAEVAKVSELAVGETILAVQNVSKVFGQPQTATGRLRERIGIGSPAPQVHAVRDVDLDLKKGQVLGLVGESGSGKSTLGRIIAGIIPPQTGSVSLLGKPVMSEGKAPHKITTKVQTVFQDPYASLNGRMRIGDIIAEGPLAHRLINRSEAQEYVRGWLLAVGLDPSFATRFPHQFSGGQRQRVAIARALAMQPEVIVCDEPVASLDVSIQAQIVNLLMDLRQRLDLSLVFISHDLSVVRHLCDRVAVMYRGSIVEQQDTAALYATPQHAYTKRLLATMPSLNFGTASAT